MQSIHVAQRQEACTFCRPTTVLPQFEIATRLVNENAYRFGLAVLFTIVPDFRSV